MEGGLSARTPLTSQMATDSSRPFRRGARSLVPPCYPLHFLLATLLSPSRLFASPPPFTKFIILIFVRDLSPLFVPIPPGLTFQATPPNFATFHIISCPPAPSRLALPIPKIITTPAFENGRWKSQSASHYVAPIYMNIGTRLWLHSILSFGDSRNSDKDHRCPIPISRPPSPFPRPV